MPVNSIVHIKPIDVVKGDLEKVVDDMKLMKLTIDELKRDIKKINIKLKARESIDDEVSGGWWYWS
jgi:hypothetical protein|tara:strand:- start:298 stop:495 length:198 start_codon:yes stop_codon:yes gene_type:complete